MDSFHRMDRRLTVLLAGIAIGLVMGMIMMVSSDGRASNDPVVPGTPDTTSAATPPPNPSASGNPDKGKPQDLTAEQVAFHDDMRKLWEDHVTWTRLAIVNFAADAPGYEASANRLLENQTDIGNAIKPYYGDQAGADLTTLLEEHIFITREILEAAKAGDDYALQVSTDKWYVNADQIADFLAAANPDNWSQEELRAAMKTHLDQTLAEATAELQGDYDASVNTYEEVHLHILEMSDVLSSGIIAQFPEKFEN